MKYDEFDVIIAGAGAGGMMAARKLALSGKKTLVLEARNRIGGRIFTVNDESFELPVELGAEFIHGDLECTLGLLKEAGIKTTHSGGTVWSIKDGVLQKQEGFIENYSDLIVKLGNIKTDISVHDFIKNALKGSQWKLTRKSLKAYVEGYYAGKTGLASSFALREDLTGPDEDQYRVSGGYGLLIEFLKNEFIQAKGTILLEQNILKVDWENGCVTVFTKGNVYKGKKLLVTVPISLIQDNSIKFHPDISRKTEVSRQLGYGKVVKVIFQFRNRFWAKTDNYGLDKAGFIFSDEKVPTWWTQYPNKHKLLVGWCGGPKAEDLSKESDHIILKKSLNSLNKIFEDHLNESPIAGKMHNWNIDPFSKGAYSFDVVNGNKLRAIMREPINDTIYFAGEGLVDGPEIGTVEAALKSGELAAKQILDCN